MKKTIIFLTMCCVFSLQAQSWNLTGNAGTTPGTNFLGTTDNKDLIFKINNSERMRLTQFGSIFQFDSKFNIDEEVNAFIIYNDPQDTNHIRVDGQNQIVYLQEDFYGGKVVIGSKTLANCASCTGYKLFVKDGIKTEKVKVEIAANSGWADYVFKEDYQLMSLKKLEGFIKENGHLPEVPTTEEAIKNGIELKEMNILLLKKIEELTLHLIEQDKRINELENNR